MITLSFACILTGCLQDVPVIVGGDPVRHFAREITKPKQKIDKSAFSCYVEGVFYRSCPN